MAFINKEKKYKWTFANIGGSARVRIDSGDDIAHLSELDPKMWTVLSCPTTGLEIDDKSLQYMDCDNDGKLRVSDVVTVSQWIMELLKDKDLILKGEDFIDINQINTDNDKGKKLYSSAKQILQNLGKDTSVISISDTADSAAIFAKTRFNGDGVITESSTDDSSLKEIITAAVAATGGSLDRSGVQGVTAEQIESFYKSLSDYIAWNDAVVEPPFGDVTDSVIEAYNALDAKVKDFFMRAKLAAFSPESTTSLDVQTALINNISAENLSTKNDEIANYPLVRISGKTEIDLDTAVNPAWSKYFGIIKTIVDKDKTTLTEDDWPAIGGKFAAYAAWKSSKPAGSVESLGIDNMRRIIEQDNKAALLEIVAQDLALKEEADNIELVNRFLYIYRDFYRLLNNFVTFKDFYDKDKDVKAIFQSGRLIIDQRECMLCIRVNDTAKHSASAASSGMYMVYCDCTTKSKPGKIQIAAAVTVGDIGALSVGKNGIYYDEDGLEWDAVVTKIVDNPINISQSFWSPYRRMATAIENLVNKSAAEKDSKMMAKATAEITAAPTKTADTKTVAAAPPFDIAKFAGIFAAIGMAVGMIGTALASIFNGLFALKWWQLILVFVCIILVISGPAMVMAWLKMRRRNIAPLLNANGWAINAVSKISIPFGETLTDIAKYPNIKFKDPYAKKGLKTWQKWFISFITIAFVLFVLWLFNILSFVNDKFNSPLRFFNKTENTEISTDTIQTVKVEEVTDGVL